MKIVKKVEGPANTLTRIPPTKINHLIHPQLKIVCLHQYSLAENWLNSTWYQVKKFFKLTLYEHYMNLIAAVIWPKFLKYLIAIQSISDNWTLLNNLKHNTNVVKIVPDD